MVQPYYLYILRSQRNGRFYTGIAKEVSKRVEQHNTGKVKATRYYRPFELVHIEEYPDGTQARIREHHIKSQKSHKFIEQLIAGD